jgi:hypothetical protein
MSAKEAIAKAPSGRPVRQSTGLRNKFNYANKEAGYEYRVAVDNDGTGDRIAELKELGYELVPAGLHRQKDSRVDTTSPEGSVEQMSVGGGHKGYLMRIKKEWFDEDRKAKDARVDATEAGLRNPSTDGINGTIDRTK